VLSALGRARHDRLGPAVDRDPISGVEAPPACPAISRTDHQGLKINYIRVSTVGQDLTAQRDGLAALGVDAERVCVDHGLTGTSRSSRSA